MKVLLVFLIIASLVGIAALMEYVRQLLTGELKRKREAKERAKRWERWMEGAAKSHESEVTKENKK